MLTKEQQDIIEQNLWIVNSVLKKQGLSYDNDLRQSAILYMCICLERFNPAFNVQFSTYVYKSVYLYVKRKHLAEIKTKKMEAELDYSTDKAEDNESDVLNKLRVSDVLNKCSDTEQKILKMKMRGYTHKEIGDELNCSVWVINRAVADIKRKFKNDPP